MTSFETTQIYIGFQCNSSWFCCEKNWHWDRFSFEYFGLPLSSIISSNHPPFVLHSLDTVCVNKISEAGVQVRKGRLPLLQLPRLYSAEQQDQVCMMDLKGLPAQLTSGHPNTQLGSQPYLVPSKCLRCQGTRTTQTVILRFYVLKVG